MTATAIHKVQAAVQLQAVGLVREAMDLVALMDREVMSPWAVPLLGSAFALNPRRTWATWIVRKGIDIERSELLARMSSETSALPVMNAVSKAIAARLIAIAAKMPRVGLAVQLAMRTTANASYVAIAIAIVTVTRSANVVMERGVASNRIANLTQIAQVALFVCARFVTKVAVK